MTGPSAGDKQAVNQSELTALMSLLDNTSELVPVSTDSDICIRDSGISKCKQRFKEPIVAVAPFQRRDHFLQWVPSNQTEAEFVQGTISPWQCVTNYVADKLASNASDNFLVPWGVANCIHDIDVRAATIRAQLAAVRSIWFSLKESEHKCSILDDSPNAAPVKIVSGAVSDDDLKFLENTSHDEICKKFMSI